MAGRHNYTIDQGRTWRRWIVLWQNREKTVPVPLDNFTAKLEIKPVGGGADVISLTTENGGITITGNLGKIEWIATDEQTAALAGEYQYELFIVNSLGESTSVLKGSIFTSPERAD